MRVKYTYSQIRSDEGGRKRPSPRTKFSKESKNQDTKIELK